MWRNRAVSHLEAATLVTSVLLCTVPEKKWNHQSLSYKTCNLPVRYSGAIGAQTNVIGITNPLVLDLRPSP